MMFHSTSVLEFFLYLTSFYLAFIFLERHYFGQIDFMTKWKISRATAMDIACKTISSGFAILSTASGLFLLLSSASYTPIIKERSSFFIDRVMILAMSYFIYDFFAMYHVYLARNDANLTRIVYREGDYSHKIKRHKSDVDKNDASERKVITSDVKSTENVASSGEILMSNCDKNGESITENTNGISTTVISRQNLR